MKQKGAMISFGGAFFGLCTHRFGEANKMVHDLYQSCSYVGMHHSRSQEVSSSLKVKTTDQAVM